VGRESGKLRGKLTIPNLEPSPELSYVLGVMYGDGSGVNYGAVSLEVKDKEFAEEFAYALSNVLGVKLDVYVIRRGSYLVATRSRVFCEYLQLPLEVQEMQIRYYPAQFIRGLFDSEATSSHYFIVIRCSNKELLYFASSLLSLFGITSTEIKLVNSSVKRIGKPHTLLCEDKLRSKFDVNILIPKKPLYEFFICGKENLSKFIKEIGFTIYRKSECLEYLLGGF